MNELLNFENDPRKLCKYGINCYQKNPNHHKSFKHPKLIEKNDIMTAKDESDSPPTKKIKVFNESHFNDEEEKKDNANVEEAGVSDFVPLPSSPIDVKENIKQKFLVEMPQDFYDFWSFCGDTNSSKPEKALSELGLILVGPYDILNGNLQNLKNKTQSNYLCHWRYYYDPPEFQTVIAAAENEYHIGYFRDDPLEDPAFVASMSNTKEGIICPLGDNIFAAVSHYISSKIEKLDVFEKNNASKVLKKIKDYCAKKSYSLEIKTQKMKERQKKVVSKSFHSAGIVVPIDEKTEVGYREIPETTASLKRMLKKVIDAPTKEKQALSFVDIQELMTNAQWATDEGDFGMGLELGIDLFMYGGEVFHSSIKHLLCVAYELLDRPAFALIIKAHLENRRKGAKMSIISDEN